MANTTSGNIQQWCPYVFILLLTSHILVVPLHFWKYFYCNSLLAPLTFIKRYSVSGSGDTETSEKVLLPTVTTQGRGEQLYK